MAIRSVELQLQRLVDQICALPCGCLNIHTKGNRPCDECTGLVAQYARMTSNTEAAERFKRCAVTIARWRKRRDC